MKWALASLILASLLWWGRFWLALFGARILKRIARGRQRLRLRRWARGLARYADR